MVVKSLARELSETTYPGRGIVIGRSEDGTKAVSAYFIMGRSENSRNRVFVEDGEGIRTQAFDPSKLTDPSLIIYAPVRVLGNDTIVTNGDQTDTIYDEMKKGKTFEQALHLVFQVFFTLKMATLAILCQFLNLTWATAIHVIDILSIIQILRLVQADLFTHI